MGGSTAPLRSPLMLQSVGTFRGAGWADQGFQLRETPALTLTPTLQSQNVVQGVTDHASIR